MPTGELERDEARKLFACAVRDRGVARLGDPAEVALRVVAPRLTPRFKEALRALGCLEKAIREGIVTDVPLQTLHEHDRGNEGRP